MKLTQLVTERYEDLDEEELIQELLGHFINMEKFIPKKADMSNDRRDFLKKEIYKYGTAYAGISKDIIAVITQMRKKGMIE